IELVQNLLEPKLVCLMDRYEKQLVVMSGTRQAILKINQVGNAKVFVIRKRRIVAVILSHKGLWSLVSGLWYSRLSSKAEDPRPKTVIFRKQLPPFHVLENSVTRRSSSSLRWRASARGQSCRSVATCGYPRPAGSR